METDIDILISSLYTKDKYSELEALSKLFNNDFLERLEKLLNIGCRNEEYFRESYKISYGWIDKIPLAKYTNTTKNLNNFKIKSKTELGDIIFIYTNTNKDITGKSLDRISDTRASIVQAKIATKAFPLTPIGKMSRTICSTSKELKLLSDWPEFDLYKTSNSLTPVLNKLNLDIKKQNRKFSGYFSKNWYFGNPQFNSICDKTFGKFLVDLINQREGQSFENKSNKTDWDKLVNKIINICGEYNLPPYLFGKRKPRFLDLSYLYSTPILLYFYFFGIIIPRKKFHVLIINKISEEGKKNRD